MTTNVFNDSDVIVTSDTDRQTTVSDLSLITATQFTEAVSYRVTETEFQTDLFGGVTSEDVTGSSQFNATGGSGVLEFRCAENSPKTGEFFGMLPPGGYVLIVFLFLATATTVGIYVEEVFYIVKTFKIGLRKKKTIWILAFFPAYAVCGFLSVLVPRSGTLVDMVANTFFGTCLYNFGRLMINYMGGGEKVWEIIGPDRHVQFNTPPCCCCCVCIPPKLLTRPLLFRFTLQVMQVAIVRPLLMFIAAVLWTNESYHAGNMSLGNGFIYISVINIISTLVAVYGLMLMRRAFGPELEKDFLITGKILSLQLTLISSAIPNFIIGILVSTEVIPCSSFFPSKTRGEEIYHALLVFLMLPFSMLGRHFFRRSTDGWRYAQPPGSTELSTIALKSDTSDNAVASTVKAAAAAGEDVDASHKGVA